MAMSMMIIYFKKKRNDADDDESEMPMAIIHMITRTEKNK